MLPAIWRAFSDRGKQIYWSRDLPESSLGVLPDYILCGEVSVQFNHVLLSGGVYIILV